MIPTARAGANAERQTLAGIEACWVGLAGTLAQAQPERAVSGPETAARHIVEALLFLHLCRGRGVDPIGASGALTASGVWPQHDPTLAPPLGRSAIDELTVRLECGAGAWLHAPVEILGQVHQHLLGRRLRRDRRGVWRATAEPQTRKASGVFYTPEPIRRYVIAQTIGGDRAVDPAVLDPACGGGWFLLTACRALLHGLRRQGVAEPCLAAAERLYGVDIDPQAVLVARRSLWLELMADIAPGAGGVDLGRAIAGVLGANLRCGDVLSEPVFDRPGGFDLVIGNPPYRRELGNRELLDRLSATPLGQKYRAPRMDLWYYFVHRGLELLRPGGRLSLVVGSYWLSGRGAEKLIGQLRDAAHIDELLMLDRDGVFPGVAGRQMILTVSNAPGTRPTMIKRGWPGGAPPEAPSELSALAAFAKSHAQLFHSGRIDLAPPADDWLAQLERWPPLGSLGIVRQGIAENPAAVTPKTNRQQGGVWRDGEGVFVLTDAELSALHLPDAERQLLRPYHDLSDLGRYRIAERPSRTLIYATAETCPDIDRFPVLRAHLARFRPILRERRETRLGRRAWWQLHWPREERLWRAAKLVAVQMAARPAMAVALGPAYVPFSVNVFLPGDGTGEHLYYLAALLNSRLLAAWYEHRAKHRGVGLEINGHVLAATPIRRIDFHDPADRARHDRLVALAAAEHRSVDAALDDEIDRLVAGLYGL